MTLEQITANLTKLTGDIKKKAVAVIEVEAVKSIKKNFEVGGRPAWKPSIKRGKLKGTKTLVVSGALSDVSASADPSAGTVTITANPASRAYAKIQNEGGEINMPSRAVRRRTATKGKNKGKTVFASSRHKKATETRTKAYKIVIPARPFMVIPPEDIEGIKNKIKSAINI